MVDRSQGDQREERNEHRDVLRGSAAALAVKVASAGASFGFSLVLARTLGAAGAGQFYVAQNIAALSSVLARMGFDQSLVRELGAAVAVADNGAVRSSFRYAIWLSSVASAALALLVMFAAEPLAVSVFDDPGSAAPIRAMSAAIVPISLATLLASALRGVHQPVQSMIVLNLLTPLLASVLVLLALPTAGVTGAAWAWCIGASAAFLWGLWSFNRNTLRQRASRSHTNGSAVLRGAWPLLWIMVVRQVNTVLPGLVLASFASSRDVGLYNAAARMALLTSFVLLGVNAVVGARFAAAFRLGDYKRVRSLARYTTKLMALAALPVVALFVSAPAQLMSVFGPEFAAAGALLAIMAVGQYINVATGSVQILLIMSGNERTARANMTAALLVCVAGCATLVPALGATGAACTAAATVAVQNLAGAWQVRQKLRGGAGSSDPLG